ncbi:MAG: 16S rRNA (cytosine(967)-C(5))-methyltransferase [Betaproteobacteria bacterium RBG_16_58_11]|nr:MAG: 16S rRNA (cytosine(967)-C(5))-methyltransferase [Betaproteobacteria bacterium RBG_16_58_11]OFZ99163.1 MAG: 16S rRNA (cytosine(967)-C(5))-methyltransferase [Betaproteobacteria bacterium RBG_19FT_COMBO_58_11]
MLEPQALAAALLGEVLAGRNLNEVLSDLWRREPGLPPRVRGAVQDLSFGALRFFSRLDFLLQALITRPITHEGVRCLLLVSLYQLIYSKTRPYAVVDRAVESARGMDAPWAAGFVNGVLRNFLRTKEELLARADGFEPARYSHPQWWIDRLRQDYPDAWEAILEANNSHPPMTLRVNRRQIEPEQYLALLQEAELEAEMLEGGALRLKKPVSVDKLPRFADGLVSVQDQGAQRAASLLDLAPGQRVLDACAAPGGKAAHILETADVMLTALDKDEARLKRVAENFARLNLKGRLIAGDAAEPQPWWDGKPYDRILADVPCSASGVVRRHPDIKWLRRPSDLAQFATTQRTILAALWRLLAPGGKLLYATCSLFHEENDDIVTDFVASHPDAKRLLISELPSGQLLPSAEHDGFFYALLEKSI